MGFLGDVGNFFGTLFGGPGGPTTTVKGTTTQQGLQQNVGGQQSTSTTTPNLPQWYNTFLQGIPGQYSPLMSVLQQQMQGNLYGPQQQANYQQQLNRQLAGASQDINSQLASRGALNSNLAGMLQGQLALGGAQQMGNYLAQIPLLNREAQSQAAGQYGNLLGNLQNFRIPFGQTTSGTDIMNQIANMAGQTNQTQTQQQTGGLLNSLLGGALGNLFRLLGGGGGGVQNMQFDPNANTGWQGGPMTPPPYSPGQ